MGRAGIVFEHSYSAELAESANLGDRGGGEV